MKRPLLNQADIPGSSSAPVRADELMSVLFPNLWGYLADEAFEDGTLRLGATLLVFAEDGLWKACLNDRACERCCWASGGTPEEVLSSMEASLEAGLMQWRARPTASPPSRQKKS